MSSGRFRSAAEKEFFINYFCPLIAQICTDDWKKHLKPRLWWLRSIDLTCCPSVLCLKASFCTARKYITVFTKTQPSQRQKHKKGSAHGWIGSTHLLFYVFARRRGDFAEMMGVRGEVRGACSPELTSSQTSRHAVPTASTGVFSVFFKILLQGLICI